MTFFFNLLTKSDKLSFRKYDKSVLVWDMFTLKTKLKNIFENYEKKSHLLNYCFEMGYK